MSGLASAPAPERPRPKKSLEDDLFKGLVVSNPPRKRSRAWMPASFVVHLVALAALVLIPIFWPSTLPEHPDYIRALIYNPPPPPPPPLPKGSALVEKPQPPKPVTPDTTPEKPKLVAEVRLPEETELRPEARERESEQKGSEHGSDIGVPEGMEEGIEGGVVGGVPGGVIGGVVGGTGDVPVMDYDQPPRLIKQTKPQYPQEAFVRKIEGSVDVEVLIDTSGRVARAAVVRSNPVFDANAVQCATQWLFAPAIKHGRPVPTKVTIIVSFRIL